MFLFVVCLLLSLQLMNISMILNSFAIPMWVKTFCIGDKVIH